MAGIEKLVRVALTEEEKETLRKASQIIDEIADSDGADIVYEICDNYNSGLFYISSFIDNMIDNSVETN